MQSNTFSRRQFLKYGLLFGGGPAAVLGGVFVASGYSGKLLALSSYGGRVVKALAETILPPKTTNLTAEEGAQLVVRRLDEELFFVKESIRADFNASLYLLEVLPMSYGYFSRFSTISVEERAGFLEKLARTDSDLERVMFTSLRMGVLMVYYGHEETWSDIGYPGPFTGKHQLPTDSRKYYAQQIKES